MGILVQELAELFGVDQVSVLKKRIKNVVTRGCEWMNLVKRKKEASHPTDGLSFSLSQFKVIFPWLPLIVPISSLLEGRPGPFRKHIISGL